MSFLQNIFSEKEPAKKSGTGLLLCLGIGGMVLILLSELLPAKKQTTVSSASQNTLTAVSEYQQQMENRLEGLIGNISGAGKTEVMVTFESGEQTLYAVDTRDGQTESQQTHVVLSDGTALAETVRLPAVCGVAVVCEGGGQPAVEMRITEMLASLLDLSTSRISVEQMN